MSEAVVSRSAPASGMSEPSPLPGDYEAWNAKKKLQFLWEEKIMKSAYPEGFPPIEDVNVFGLIGTDYSVKMGLETDQAPPGWKKAIHPRGSVAQVKFEPSKNQPFTGLFETGGIGLLRMSITGKPDDRGFAPGLALKILVDGKPSRNVSALIRLKGSDDRNLFRGDFSNIVPSEKDLGLQAINLVFRRASKYPRKLYMQDWAEVRSTGEVVESARWPFQVFFRPTDEVNHFKPPHEDFRKELSTLKPGVKVFDVLAVDPGEYTDDAASKAAREIEKDHEAYKSKTVVIGAIKSTSRFVASSYGDSYLFFKHQSYANR